MGWERAGTQAEARRRKRLEASSRVLPEVKRLCEENGILIKPSREGSLRFEYEEYVIEWPMGTNRITVQSRISGHGGRVRFFPSGSCAPKILAALRSVLALYDDSEKAGHAGSLRREGFLTGSNGEDAQI